MAVVRIVLLTTSIYLALFCTVTCPRLAAAARSGSGGGGGSDGSDDGDVLAMSKGGAVALLLVR